jgi:hypothetical protein
VNGTKKRTIAKPAARRVLICKPVGAGVEYGAESNLQEARVEDKRKKWAQNARQTRTTLEEVTVPPDGIVHGRGSGRIMGGLVIVLIGVFLAWGVYALLAKASS